MADPPATNDTAERPGIVGRLLAVRDWATATRGRSLATIAGLVAALTMTVGGWLYVGALTSGLGDSTWRDAIDALGRREYEVAEKTARTLQASRASDGETLAASLFVLGSIRAHEATQQWSDERRWIDYRIASNYLLKAIEIGLPEELAQRSLTLAGRSLLESHQAAKAIDILRQALQNEPSQATELHRLLAVGYARLATPDFAKSLEHSQILIETLDPVGPSYADAVLRHSLNLAKLGNIAEARLALEKTMSPADGVAILAAKIDLIEAEAALKKAELTADQASRDTATQLLKSARGHLDTVPRSSAQWSLARLLAAHAMALEGNIPQAIDQLAELRQSHASGTYNTLAAVEEGDLLVRAGKLDRAVVAYRRGLTSMGDVRMYMSEEVPLSELRRRYVSAVEELQFRQQYLLANDLARDLTPLIGRTRQLEVLARVLQSWGTHLIASSEDDWQKQGLAAQGRAKLRESGAAFEQLAQRRFATPHYIDDLWQACENYFWGHSYSSSTRVLGDYLRYEPEKRNAQALLRLGQSQLARGNTQRGITALEECIELHPDDAATYQARLDCAAGYRNLGDDKQAEDYLLANLAGSLQSPRSPEWRDSLFALGHLLHDTGRFTEAIDRLEEAIDRYPTDKKSRLARYLVADSYRQAADAPLAELKLAQTENEREKASREATRLLSEAINRYEQVQRDIALGSDPNELDRAMLRNCYMMRADALFDLQRYEEASKAYSNVSTLYQSEPFVLETLIQIANCQRRLNEPLKAQLTVEQAKLALERLPPDADYTTATNFTREQWRLILDDMGRWKR